MQGPAAILDSLVYSSKLLVFVLVGFDDEDDDGGND